MHTHSCTNTCTSKYTLTYTHTHMHTQTLTHMHTHTHRVTHTHIHTHKSETTSLSMYWTLPHDIMYTYSPVSKCHQIHCTVHYEGLESNFSTLCWLIVKGITDFMRKSIKFTFKSFCDHKNFKLVQSHIFLLCIDFALKYNFCDTGIHTFNW